MSSSKNIGGQSFSKEILFKFTSYIVWKLDKENHLEMMFAVARNKIKYWHIFGNSTIKIILIISNNIVNIIELIVNMRAYPLLKSQMGASGRYLAHA